MTPAAGSIPPRGTAEPARGSDMEEPTYSVWQLPWRIARKIRVDPESGCWLWQGRPAPNGYGQVRMQGSALGAHRVVYEFLVTEIPFGLVLDHLCSVRICVNPEHLEPVTQAENARRSGVARRKDTCGKGHPLTGPNVNDWRGRRACRTCKAAADARRRTSGNSGRPGPGQATLF